MSDAESVAVYNLPGVTFNQNLVLTDTQSDRVGMVATNDRLYVARDDGLSVVDTANGSELYYGEPINTVSWDRVAVMRLSPNGKRLYVLNIGLSPASLHVFNVESDTPTYIGEDCCHGCIGGNGRDMQISPDGESLYVAVGGQYYLQVLNAEPLLYQKNAGLTGPYPNSVAASADGDFVYVGYSDNEFAAFRTSDWLPFHVGPLLDNVAARGLALAYDQVTLAAAVEFPSFDPERIELISVGNLVANRGGIKTRPLDSIENVPIANARIADPSQGLNGYFDTSSGFLGRAPIDPDTYDIDITASGHATESRRVNVNAGAWTNLGDIVMTRTGVMPDPRDVCASPAGDIGETVTIDVTGSGFFPGPGLGLTTTDPNVTIEDWTYLDWSRISATVTVDPGATPGFGSNTLRVTNPDGEWDTGGMLRMPPGVGLFDDGFEAGTAENWSGAQP